MLQKITRSTVIDAPIERVWAVLRAFNSHEDWHDVVASSAIERDEPDDRVGCVRSFTLKDGHAIREQLLSLNDREFKSSYCIVESTVPLQRYVAHISLKPVTDGQRTFWHWESSFATPPGQEAALSQMVAQGVYEAGFDNLRRHLRQGADQRRPGAPVMPTALPLGSRSVVLQAYGGTDQLRAQNTEAAAPGPGEVRIQQRAIGVNFIDVYLRRGWLPHMLQAGGTPGLEAAGQVLDVGAGVHGLLPGDRVAYLGPVPGAYCSVRTVPAAWVVPLPPAVEDEQVAALLLKGLTADMLLRDVGHVGPGTRLLVHAAAGGVGLLLCAWAKSLGATVMGTVSSEAKARLAREFGCQHVIVQNGLNDSAALHAAPRFADAVQQLCGGADVIVDGLGQAAAEENWAALAPCGHWISLGHASGELPHLDPGRLGALSATFSSPVVLAYTANPAQLAARAQRLWAALQSGALKMPPIERHTLEAAAQAHERLESRRTTGALVLLA
jgi:NADPH:quinone reductase